MPQIPTLKSLGYKYFGLPDFGDYFVDYNFKNKTGHFNNVVAQLYFRQAMQHLEDQAGQIEAFFGGDGDPAYGPIPVCPRSPFLPSNAATKPDWAATPALISSEAKWSSRITSAAVMPGTAMTAS